MTDNQIADHFNTVRLQINEAEKRAGRSAGSVALCAVSKFHPIQSIYAALKADQLLFGENRVQEAYAKFTELNSDESLVQKPQLHIIGSLQLNKVKHAVEISSCIQSVDRIELLDEIEKQCAKLNKRMNVLFEVHTGEESKAGYTDRQSLDQSLQCCAEGKYPHIVPCGFMTMAPFTTDEHAIHLSFSSLRIIKEESAAHFPSLPLTQLSMGMSNDYQIAILEGSTMVRIGTALFGEREYPAGAK